MRACVVQTPGRLAVEDVESPTAGAGELLLQVHACGICGSDLHAVHAMPTGTILGHEFSGEVRAVGAEVEGWKEGDRVVALPFFCCGECPPCRAGEGMFCGQVQGLGLGQRPGAYAELVRVQPSNCLRVPEAVSLRDAALVEPLAVGLHGVRRSMLAPGDTCIIIGAGPIGVATLLWAKELGAKTVVSDPSPGRRSAAERLGATAVVDPTKNEPVFVAQEISTRPASVIFECVGVKSLLHQAMMMAPLRAQIVVLGVCMENDEIFPLSGIMKELRIDFALAYSKAEFGETLAALASGRIDAGSMITDEIGLGAVPQMFETLARPSSQCKVLIELG